MDELREKVIALMGLADRDMAAGLIIDIVARGLGKLGGRPRKPVTNPLETGLEPVTHPVTKPVSQEPDSVSPAPPSDPGSFLTLRADPERAIPVPPLLVFPCDGEPKEFGLTEDLRKEHGEAFPSLNVMGEYRKALAWIKSSPQNRKTARGMPKFLFGWLGRTQNSGGARGRAMPVERGSPPPPEVPAMPRAAKDRVRSTWTEPQPAGALLDEMPGWMEGQKR